MVLNQGMRHRFIDTERGLNVGLVTSCGYLAGDFRVFKEEMLGPCIPGLNGDGI
jgi:hypothetical protein